MANPTNHLTKHPNHRIQKGAIAIITKLPSNRPNRRSDYGPYYMGYVNHMWNLYMSRQDAAPATANDIDLNDWTICRDVFASLRPVEQSLILARHNPNRANREDMFHDCCDTIGLSDQTACAIVQSIAKIVAEKRGLIAPRNHQDNLQKE